MKKQIFALTLCALTLSACQNNVSTTTNSNKTAVNSAVSTNAVVASPTPTASSEIKYYEGKGVVTEINLQNGWLEINHEKIEGLMPAMIMQFNVEDQSQLKALKVGDKVTFTLEDNKGAEKLTKISKIK